MHVIAIMVAEIKHATIHACYVLCMFLVYLSQCTVLSFFF